MAYVQRYRTRDGEWRYRVRFRDATGRHVSRSFRLRRDADAFLRRVHADQLAGLVPDVAAGRELLGDYFPRWLESRRVRGRPLTPRTVELYRSLWRRWIAPTFARTAVASVTADRVRAWHAMVSVEGSANVAAKAYRLLAAVYRTLEHDGTVMRSPCRLRGAAVERAVERPLLEPADVVALADAIAAEYRLLVELAGWCGLRLGELLGLERRHVDVLHRTIRVEQAAYEGSGSGRYVAEPKTEAGVRTVSVPSPLVPLLVDHLDRFAAPGSAGVVFTGPHGGPLRRATFYKAWRAARTAAGLPHVRFHDLRHAAGTLAAVHGATEREVMAQLGHRSHQAARRYQHAAEDRARLLADRLAATIEAARQVPDAEVRRLPG